MDSFLRVHATQLASAGIPARLHAELRRKLEDEVCLQTHGRLTSNVLSSCWFLIHQLVSRTPRHNGVCWQG